MTPSLFVIIPVYGNWDDTVACVAALKRQTTSDFVTFVADDGSPTPAPEGLRTDPSLHYFRRENVGFGANCNRAAQQAILLGATHFLFLNNDTSFGPDFIRGWQARAAQLPGSILSPLVFWSANPNRIWSSGGRLSIWTPFVRSRARFDKLTEVDTVTGCALLVPATAWKQLGGFDAAYGMYFEDFDLTLRAKQLGIKTFIVPDRPLFVWHHVSASFRGRRLWQKHELMMESALIFIRRHYFGAAKPVCLALSGAHLAITTLLSLPQVPRPMRLWNALSRGLSR